MYSNLYEYASLFAFLLYRLKMTHENRSIKFVAFKIWWREIEKRKMYFGQIVHDSQRNVYGIKEKKSLINRCVAHSTLDVWTSVIENYSV